MVCRKGYYGTRNAVVLANIFASAHELIPHRQQGRGNLCFSPSAACNIGTRLKSIHTKLQMTRDRSSTQIQIPTQTYRLPLCALEILTCAIHAVRVLFHPTSNPASRHMSRTHSKQNTETTDSGIEIDTTRSSRSPAIATQIAPSYSMTSRPAISISSPFTLTAPHGTDCGPDCLSGSHPSPHPPT